MKKLMIILLLSIPVVALAQENFIGKPRAEIKAYFKKANVAISESSTNNGVISDQYKAPDGQDITCFFGKTNSCNKELVVAAFANMVKFKGNFDREWAKAGDNIWINKAKTVKARFVAVEPLGQLYIFFVAL